MKKIIIINRFFYPDQSATSQILTDLLFNITPDLDSKIHVVSSRGTYENNAVLPKRENKNNISIHRVWTSNFGRGNLFGRALDYVTFYIFAFISLLFLVNKNDIVVAKTDPPVISFVAYLVARIKGARLINWIQDLFPEVAGALGVLGQQSIIYKFLNSTKNISLRAADMNVVIGEVMAGRLIKLGITKDKISVVHNWNINTNTKYVPKLQNELVKKWGLIDKFVIGYSGNFGRAHEYHSIKQLIVHYASHEDVVFLFIGGGKYYTDLKNFVEQRDYKNIVFKPYQSIENLNQSLSVADVHLISLNPELEGLIVPSKFYGLASIGAPIIFIGNISGQISRTLVDSNSGFAVSNDDIKGLIELVGDLISGKQKTSEVSTNLKKLYNENYTPEVAYQKWKEIFSGIQCE